VLTRLPSPRRALPETAAGVLAVYFGSDAEICGLDPEDCWSAITDLARYGRGGGRIYDAVIALSTYRAGASVLLTWNVKDFLLVAPPGLEVRVP